MLIIPRGMDNTVPILQPTQIPVINLALDTLQKRKQALVFVNTKASAEKTAEDIAKKVKITEAEKTPLKEIASEILKAITQPTKQCERLAKCVEKGVAFHHAGLTSSQKEIIEDQFRQGLL